MSKHNGRKKYDANHKEEKKINHKIWYLRSKIKALKEELKELKNEKQK